MTQATPLTGQLLIAMPGMADPRFEHAVVFVCAHSEEGAMGLIVNKPTEDVTLTDLLDQLSIETLPDARRLKVHFGGPVEAGRGFVLHSPDYQSSISSLQVDDRFCMTATLDVLEEFARGAGPRQALMALGYAGWGPGQLEAELAQNGWLTCDADPALVFSTDDAGKWQAALRLLGVDALMLSGSGGRA
ncbi:MAG: YqgE/AlgH family protein [Paracoccaceae bacterium]